MHLTPNRKEVSPLRRHCPILEPALLSSAPLLLTSLLLAGAARWGMPLRAYGTAGFCFVRRLTHILRVRGSPKKL